MNPSNLVCFLILFLNSMMAFCQADSSRRRSPITLDTVVVSSKEQKVTRVRLKGFPSYNGLTQTKAVVSHVDGLPAGMLKSVSFYFNCGLVNYLKKSLKINYKDVELGLLVYKANADSTLGEVISENELKFTVPAGHRGAYKLDLSRLKVNERSIFIGFSVLSKLPAEENNIYVRYNESKSGISYVKMKLPFLTDDWRRPISSNPTELRLNLEVLQ